MASFGLVLMCIAGWFLGFVVFGALMLGMTEMLFKRNTENMMPLYILLYLFLTGAVMYNFGS